MQIQFLHGGADAPIVPTKSLHASQHTENVMEFKPLSPEELCAAWKQGASDACAMPYAVPAAEFGAAPAGLMLELPWLQRELHYAPALLPPVTPLALACSTKQAVDQWSCATCLS